MFTGHRRRSVRCPAATDRALRGALLKALLAPACCPGPGGKEGVLEMSLELGHLGRKWGQSVGYVPEGGTSRTKTQVKRWRCP